MANRTIGVAYNPNSENSVIILWSDQEVTLSADNATITAWGEEIDFSTLSFEHDGRLQLMQAIIILQAKDWHTSSSETLIGDDEMATSIMWLEKD